MNVIDNKIVRYDRSKESTMLLMQDGLIDHLYQSYTDDTVPNITRNDYVLYLTVRRIVTNSIIA